MTTLIDKDKLLYELENGDWEDLYDLIQYQPSVNPFEDLLHDLDKRYEDAKDRLHKARKDSDKIAIIAEMNLLDVLIRKIEDMEREYD